MISLRRYAAAAAKIKLKWAYARSRRPLQRRFFQSRSQFARPRCNACTFVSRPCGNRVTYSDLCTTRHKFRSPPAASEKIVCSAGAIYHGLARLVFFRADELLQDAEGVGEIRSPEAAAALCDASANFIHEYTTQKGAHWEFLPRRSAVEPIGLRDRRFARHAQRRPLCSFAEAT